MQLFKEALRGEVCDKCRQKDDNEIGGGGGVNRARRKRVYGYYNDAGEIRS